MIKKDRFDHQGELARMAVETQQLTFEQSTTARYLKALFFVLGLLLPIVSLSSGVTTGAASLTERVTFADMISVILIAILGPLNLEKFRIHPAGVMYFVSLIIGCFVGIVVAGPDGLSLVVPESAALFMAFLYWVVGYNAGTSRSLLRMLVLGIAAGILFESIIVYHDVIFSGSQWFPDPLNEGARGTFRVNSQLAAYGISTAGILLSIGWLLDTEKKTRFLLITAGLMATTFSLATSRRSAMLAIVIWLGVFLFLGLPYIRRRAYRLVLAATFIGSIVLFLNLNTLSQTFLADRIVAGTEAVVQGGSFSELQFRTVLEKIHLWFPLGVGIGRGSSIDTLHYAEFHSVHLSIAVELGILGLFSFYSMCIVPVFQKWDAAFGEKAGLARVILISFLVAAVLGMGIHNRIHRDRAFMLFLGITASAGVFHESSANTDSEEESLTE